MCVFYVAAGFTKVPSVDFVKSLSRVRLFVTPWTVACQASLSVEFPRQGHWSELPFPTPGDLPDPGIESRQQADSLPLSYPGNVRH